MPLAVGLSVGRNKNGCDTPGVNDGQQAALWPRTRAISRVDTHGIEGLSSEGAKVWGYGGRLLHSGLRPAKQSSDQDELWVGVLRFYVPPPPRLTTRRCGVRILQVGVIHQRGEDFGNESNI